MQLPYHVPVMLSQCMDGLAIRPDGVYVDVTFGGGGHSKAILERLGPTGRLFSFDQDPDALANAATWQDPRFVLINANFRTLRSSLASHSVQQIDGLLADLGVSSHQFDEGQRGFSIRADAPLDMRMDQQQALHAAALLATWSEEQIRDLLRTYGEVPIAGRIASAIVRQRQSTPVQTTGQLVRIVSGFVPAPKAAKLCAQVFQAIRIAVNDELEALRALLRQSSEVLLPGGRLVVMAYHSLEDRLVKNYIKSGNFEGAVQTDFYGNRLLPFELIERKAVEPDEAEIARNPRARSAKLRIAAKR